MNRWHFFLLCLPRLDFSTASWSSSIQPVEIHYFLCEKFLLWKKCSPIDYIQSQHWNRFNRNGQRLIGSSFFAMLWKIDIEHPRARELQNNCEYLKLSLSFSFLWEVDRNIRCKNFLKFRFDTVLYSTVDLRPIVPWPIMLRMKREIFFTVYPAVCSPVPILWIFSKTKNLIFIFGTNILLSISFWPLKKLEMLKYFVPCLICKALFDM